VTFDPFGDFDTRGYLRNTARAKDPKIVRQMEHASFTTSLDAALAELATRKTLSYEDVLATHKMLFDVVYPWAGQDRTTTASHLVVSKGSDKKKVMFANPEDIQRTVEYALKLGQDEAFMAAKPGEVMGYLAFGHPFLDGNGRAIMVLHCVLAQRAGISIDWASTNKSDYLTALTNELDDPGKGHLDAYLKPFVRKGISQSGLAANVAGAPGLDGEGEDVVLGNIDDPELKAEYRAKRLKRKEGLK
jgi:cell filamentation protein, protein adenylyltransferase